MLASGDDYEQKADERDRAAVVNPLIRVNHEAAGRPTDISQSLTNKQKPARQSGYAYEHKWSFHVYSRVPMARVEHCNCADRR